MTEADHRSEPADPASRGGGLVRLRLDLGYDGTGFAGWARQPGQRTVQGVLEEATARHPAGESVGSLVVAGRTDRGVHASGQVAHLDVAAAPADLPPLGRLLHAWNSALPADVRVQRVTVAPPGFDARFSAVSRRYCYRVADAAAGADPLRRLDTLWHLRGLDEAAMRTAGAALIGEHDFAAFCRRREGATTVRTLLRLDWHRPSDGLLVATVEADAFCHQLVRSLVGCLLAVGAGRQPPDWPAAMLAGRVRDGAVQVAPAHGLTLVAVHYPADPADLAVRAQATRRRRTVSDQPATPGS